MYLYSYNYNFITIKDRLYYVYSNKIILLQNIAVVYILIHNTIYYY